ncbi:MAG: replication/maintenance protein [Cyanobacteria bacterium QS_8_64_29]|nr:MAG: replication/maintenance protein [Cyanobacteria bacterium QS_8_64_29]
MTLTTQAPAELVRFPFARNERLPAQPDVLWQIERGAVRCLTWNEAGLPVALNYGGAGDIVGPGLSVHRPYRIECLTRVEVTSLPESRWQEAVEGIVAHARQTEELLAIVRNERVQQRLQQLLVWLARKFGRSISLGELIDLRLTHQHLAEAIGTTRVTVTRSLQSLEAQGQIVRKRRHYLILCGALAERLRAG